MADGSTGGLVWSRPALNVGGADQPALAAGLLGLTVTETVTGLFRCEALFGNWNPAAAADGYPYFDRQLLDFGKTFQVLVNGASIFDGHITALEGRFPQSAPPQITVLAEDRLQAMRMTRRTRCFAQMSDADVFRQIASDHGLSAQVDVSGPSHEVLARRNVGTLQLSLGSRLREFSVIADLAGQRTSVFAHGWDVSSKSALREHVDDSAIRGELNGDDGGAGVLSSAFGERAEALAHTVPVTSVEARAHAEAMFRAGARRFVVGRGVAETDPKLRVGGYVDLKGLGALFNGKYYVSQVRHVFDGANGIRTEFTGERPGIGRP
jgi:phage protein D